MSPRLLFFPFIILLLSSIIAFFIFFETFSSFHANLCIIVAVNEQHEDRDIRTRLDSLELGSFVSISSVHVYLDNFGSLRTIPLDEYQEQVMYFDPRNDGYADLLTNFFIRNGQRYFFLPLPDFYGISTTNLNRRLADIFSGMEYDLVVLGESTSYFYFWVNFLFYFFALFFSFLFIRKKSYFVFYLPLLIMLGFLGSSAYILSAAIMVMWELLVEPVREFTFNHRRVLIFSERIKPFKKNIATVIFVIALLFLYYYFWELNFLHLFTFFIVFLLIYFPVFFAEKKAIKKKEHKTFTPFFLLPLGVRTYKLYPTLFFISLFFSLSILVPITGFFDFNNENLLYDHSLDEYISYENYHGHVSYQRTFSYLPFGQEGIYDDAYYRYYLDEDGLISGIMVQRENEDDLPFFPLEALYAFLIEYKGDEVIEDSEYQRGEWVLASILLIFMLLDISKGRKKLVKSSNLRLLLDDKN